MLPERLINLFDANRYIDFQYVDLEYATLILLLLQKPLTAGNQGKSMNQAKLDIIIISIFEVFNKKQNI